MGGERYRFRELDSATKLSGVTAVLDDSGQTLLLLDFGCYSRLLDDGRALFWWEKRKGTSNVIAFNEVAFSNLKPILDPVEAAKAMRAAGEQSCGLNEDRSREFNCTLEAGVHRVESPSEWRVFEETLVLCSHAPSDKVTGAPSRAILSFDWLQQSVSVYPQDWFNQGKYDFDYQWITRVVRTESGAICGEAVRIGTFELDASHRQIKQWFSEDVFHMIR